LEDLENVLTDEIFELRKKKYKVGRSFIAVRARTLAYEHGVEFMASPGWLDKFFKRNNLSMRAATNFCMLCDSQVIQHAIAYMSYLRSILQGVDRSKTILMDETAVYYEDTRTRTAALRGSRYVPINATGHGSMRITVVAAVWADGRKAAPLVIHKGKKNTSILDNSRSILHTTQGKAWVNQEIIIHWVDTMFPVEDVSLGKCIIWDSCSAHIAKRVKEHCRNRAIALVVIPGGMTSYLQAGDIGIHKEFKDHLSDILCDLKNSGQIQLTKKGNPKTPEHYSVNNWVLQAWNSLSDQNIRRSIDSAGLAENYEHWHISKHDYFGSQFKEAWLRSKPNMDQAILKSLPQEESINMDNVPIEASVFDSDANVDSNVDCFSRLVSNKLN
jgi:hypothetical protein